MEQQRIVMPADEVLESLEQTLSVLRDAQPHGQGELARRYAEVIAKLEDALAYFLVHIHRYREQ